MQYKILGNTEVKVSKVGVGTWQFAQTSDWGPADIEECQRIVDYAIESGVNFFDTAEGYGQSEEILGRLLKAKRNKIILATKISSTEWDYNTVKTHLTGSLKRLQTDFVDLYQIHWPKLKHLPWGKEGMEKKDYEDIFTSMSKLKKEGLIGTAGVSNFRLPLLEEFSEEALDFMVSNQVPYSLLWRFYDVEGVSSFCKKKAIGLLAYSPLAQGLLTGRFGKDGDEVAQGIRKANLLFREPVYSRALEVVAVVKRVAEEAGTTPAQVASKWAMEQDAVVSVLVGMRKLKHLKDNIAAVDIQLTDEQFRRLDDASLEFQRSMPLDSLEPWISNCRKEDVEELGIEED